MNTSFQTLPSHLEDLVIQKSYTEYSARDHSVWRYWMKRNIHILKNSLPDAYLDYLDQTGIGIEYIPSLYGLNQKLRNFGWRAVFVFGYIPLRVQLQFLAYRVIAISAEMPQWHDLEKQENFALMHQIAGRIPFIVHVDYANFLVQIGNLASVVFVNKHDLEIEEAECKVESLKSRQFVNKSIFRQAKENLVDLLNKNEYSEWEKLKNIYYRAIEFAVIHEKGKWKAIGASLLTGANQTVELLKQATVVEMLPNFTANGWANKKLFGVSEISDFLIELVAFERTTASYRGGLFGLQEAIKLNDTATCVFSSGIQISGIFKNCIIEDNQIEYLNIVGAASLSFNYTELIGYSRRYYMKGIASPIGKLKNVQKALEDHNEAELLQYQENGHYSFEFESGIKVEGELKKTITKDGKLILIRLYQASVLHGLKRLLDEKESVFDLIVGEKIESVFYGTADNDAYARKYCSVDTRLNVVATKQAKKVHFLYHQVRFLRKKKSSDLSLDEIWDIFIQETENEWLLALEILDYALSIGNDTIATKTKKYLQKILKAESTLTDKIEIGMKLN